MSTNDNGAAAPLQLPPNANQRYQLPLQSRQNVAESEAAVPGAAAAPVAAAVPPAAAPAAAASLAASAPAAAATHPAPAQASAPPTKRRRTTVQNIYLLNPWNDMLFELLKFRHSKGNCMVPYKSGGNLAKWVSSQRSQYQRLVKEGEDVLNGRPIPVNLEPNRLTSDRVDVLNSVGFVWNVVQADNDERWKKRFAELVEYKRLHGQTNVPQSTSLGKWVKMQRENKAETDLKAAGTTPHRTKQRPCLPKERQEKLEEIGFQWRIAKPPVGWDNRFEQLKEYLRLNGDCNVPQSFPQDKPFGRWVMKQRCEHSQKMRGLKSQLTVEREARLNAIGFEWVAPGFHKKTVNMPGDDREDEEEVDRHHASGWL